MTTTKIFHYGFNGQHYLKMPKLLCLHVISANRSVIFLVEMKCLWIISWRLSCLMCGDWLNCSISIFILKFLYSCLGRLCLQVGWSGHFTGKGFQSGCPCLEKHIFSCFGTLIAITHDGGNHFCNRQFQSLLAKQGVTSKIATAYHPQTSG